MDTSNIIAVILGGASLLVGSGVGVTVICLAYHAGEARRELTLLSKALNGDGPWQRKIDSTRARAAEAKAYAESVKEKMDAAERERDKRCEESTRSLAAIQATLETSDLELIGRRKVRKPGE